MENIQKEHTKFPNMYITDSDEGGFVALTRKEVDNESFKKESKECIQDASISRNTHINLKNKSNNARCNTNLSFQSYVPRYMVQSLQNTTSQQNNSSKQLKFQSLTQDARPCVTTNAIEYCQQLSKQNISSEVDHVSQTTISHVDKPKAVQKLRLPSSTDDYDYRITDRKNIAAKRGCVDNNSSILKEKHKKSSPGLKIKSEIKCMERIDVEMKYLLEPGIRKLNIHSTSSFSDSISSITPPLPPLSPRGSLDLIPKQNEYGRDFYNNPATGTGPIGSSQTGFHEPSIQKKIIFKPVKREEQDLLKRQLFGLENDETSTTTRSIDLESLLGSKWCAGQSVSDSEADTQGLRHIRSQLEGLEHMYSEVLNILSHKKKESLVRVNQPALKLVRRRHGSLSSLPSSSISSRPTRDARRIDDQRKVRDLKGVNKRFLRLESHVVTLARSVAHLSSEMRNQHLVMVELERLREDLTSLRTQAFTSHTLFACNKTEPKLLNHTNPTRIKKLTKFFGEDPPLIRLFLKELGYEQYAEMFEKEKIGMIELPYLGEERLHKLGVPLGPRLRILQEAQISLCRDTTLCIV